ncbi:hypothetical protein ACVXHA_03065 [Escherichia coli]
MAPTLVSSGCLVSMNNYENLANIGLAHCKVR